MIKITEMAAQEFPDHLERMNQGMRQWTDRAARGECGWICADCLLSEPKGMPDECFCKNQRCTEIIQRDKRNAMQQGNEPS